MADLTLNDVKAAAAKEVAEKEEALRVERKTAGLQRLAAVETRLQTYVSNITERRAALKTAKQTAKGFLDAIAARADDEDLDIEEIETLLQSVDEAMVGANNSFANGGCVKGGETIVLNISTADHASIEEAMRDVVRNTRGRRAA